MSALPALERGILGLTLLLLACLFGVQVFVFGSPLTQAAALDTRFYGYTQGDAQAFLEAIGPEGQAAFFGYYRGLDTIFPPLLAISLILLYRHFCAARGKWALFAVLPALYLVADLTENTFLKDLSAPEDFARTVRFASSATVVKFTALLAALGLIGFRARRGRAKEE